MGEEGRLEMFRDSLDFIQAFLTPHPPEPQPSWKSFLDMLFQIFLVFLTLFCHRQKILVKAIT